MADAAPYVVSRRPTAPIAVFTVDRPRRANALSHEVLDGLRATLEAPPDGCGMLVLAGAGEVFSGGADLGCARGHCGDPRGIQELLDDVTAAVEDAAFPVVALLDGPCVGAAVELAMSCDLRLATDRASLRVPATEIGVVYRSRGLQNLRRRMPFPALQSLLLFGNVVTARRAEAWSLIERSPDLDTALADLEAMFQRVLGRPGAFAAQKASLRALCRDSVLGEDARQGMDEIRREFARPAAAGEGTGTR